MGQKPLLAFTIALILASSGCLGFGDDELEQQENEDEQETIDPVSTDNSTNQPPLVTAGIWMDDDDFLWSDDDDMVYTKYVYVSWSAVDTDGNIASAGFDMDLDMQIDETVGSDSGTIIDSTLDSDYFPGALSMSLNEGWDFERQQLTSGDDDDRCYLIMHRTFAFIAEDDDGASSAQLIHLVADYYQWGANDMDNETIAILGLSSDDVDWVTGVSSDCPEPEDDDNGGGPGQACTTGQGEDGVDNDEDGQIDEPDESALDCPSGTICVGGVCIDDMDGDGYAANVDCNDYEALINPGAVDWGNIYADGVDNDCDGSIDEDAPPDGSQCDDGNSDTTSDLIVNGVCVGTPVNHAPVIDHLGFAGEFVTNETDYVCLDFNIYDEDGDEIDGIATWLINGVTEESMAIDVCFDIGSYGVAVGDELSVTVTVWDDEYEVTATLTTIIEEEPE